MAEGFGANCAKIVLFVFNFIFWLSGTAMLGLGIWLVVDKSVLTYIEVVTFAQDDPILHQGSWVVLGTGAFIFVVGFCGCCGAVRESRCLLAVYCVLLLLVIAAEIAAGAIIGLFKKRVEDFLVGNLQDQMQKHYATNNTVGLTWDIMQIDLQCCGVRQADEWEQSKWFSSQEARDGDVQKLFVPWSCCKLLPDANFLTQEPINGTVCQSEAEVGTFRPSQLYTKGCYQKLEEWVKLNAKLVIGIGVGIACVQLLGLIFAGYLIKKIHDEKMVGVIA